MKKSDFQAYIDQGYNRVPLVQEVFADLDTPLSTYLKLANAPYSYLFESVQGGEQWGRYSIIGLPARTVIQVNNHTITVTEDGKTQLEEEVSDPLQWICDYQATIRVPDIAGLPRFNGGLVGYFGYETIRYIEPKLAQKEPKKDPINTPDILLLLSDEVVIFDNLTNRLFVIVHATKDTFHQAQQQLQQLIHKLRQPTDLYQTNTSTQHIHETDFQSGFSQTGFENAVKTVKNYIKAGDVMQVVLSQRLSIPYEGAPLDLYRALRSINPSPYMYYLDLGDFHIAGSSPEILVRLEENTVTVRPIAGTRKRGKTVEEDQALEKELLNDPKERAEHLMLIDLGRNDTGRISQIGSVQLTDNMSIERYSHVMHIVSNVIGKLKPELNAIDTLKATFPAGTVSGAPKIRAMEIIDELEPVKRGIYSGAIGYLSWNGNMDTAIAIRTAVIKDKTLYIQAGAGIVYDSVPELEWEETMNKGRAVFRAASLAAAGIDNSNGLDNKTKGNS